MLSDEKHPYKVQTGRRESPEVEALILERNELLQEYPQLKVLQDEIDTVLASTLDPRKRSEIIFMFISDKLALLTDTYRDLSTVISQVASQH